MKHFVFVTFREFENDIYIYYLCVFRTKTERKTLEPRPPPDARLLPSNRKKIPLNFQLVNPVLPSSLYTTTTHAIISRTNVAYDFSHRPLRSPGKGWTRRQWLFILRTCSAYREQWFRQPPGSNSWSTWDEPRTSTRVSAIGRRRPRSAGFESKSSAGLRKNVTINGKCTCFAQNKRQYR